MNDILGEVLVADDVQSVCAMLGVVSFQPQAPSPVSETTSNGRER
jgi:hypothetical protein